MADRLEPEETTAGVENVPGMRHHLLNVCGGPLSVYEAGEPGRPPVVMLHGAMYDEARFSWDQMFPFLSRYYHVFALDTPRHGKSRPWEGHLGHTRLISIFHETFGHLKLENFCLIGLSMGGGLSIEYASLYPGKVRSMVLFEPGGLGDKLDQQFITWLYMKTPGLLRMFSRKYAKMDDAGLKRTLESIYVGGSQPTDPDRLVALLRDEARGKYHNRKKDIDEW